MTAVKPHLPICLVGLVWLARYCGEMYGRHLFFLIVDYFIVTDREQAKLSLIFSQTSVD